jgi:hypothetical protein
VTGNGRGRSFGDVRGASAYRTGQFVSQQRLAGDQKRRHLSEAAGFPGQHGTRGGDIALQKQHHPGRAGLTGQPAQYLHQCSR